MKIGMMFIGLLVEGDDTLTADVLMNYAMNSLNIKNEAGVIRHVEVREVKVPSIVNKDNGDEATNQFHTGPIM